MIKKSTMVHFLTILTIVSTFLQKEWTGTNTINQNIEKMVKKIKNLLLDNAETKISYVEGGIVKVTINGTNGFPGVVPAAAAKDAVSAG